MRVALLLLAMTIAAACSSDEPVGKIADGCLINSDCSSPLVCAFRKCHVACTTSRDCGLGQRCVAGNPPTHVCQLADERNCSYNSDCAPGQLCSVDLQCRDQCAADRDCLAEQTCVSGTCADDRELVDGGLVSVTNPEAGAPVGGRSCLYTSECPAPLVCRNKICSSECLAIADCNPGYSCVNNQCIAGSGTLIGPAGGVVVSADGKIKLSIPANSLRSSVSILILPLEAWPDGALGEVVQILPGGLQFNPVSTLTYQYDAAQIGATAPSTLRLASAVGSTWTALDSTVDVTTKTISAPLSHLSTYGIIGPAPVVDAGNGASDEASSAGGTSSGADAAASGSGGRANGVGGASGAAGALDAGGTLSAGGAGGFSVDSGPSGAAGLQP